MDRTGQLGTLEPGTLADLLVVEGDPLQDIRVLQDQSKLTVMKGGRTV
jgi:imidazolonepropionase-like amidohydrolase